MMNTVDKLEQYLTSCRQRLHKFTLLRGGAITAAVVLALTLIGAWFSIESGFAADTTNVFRILLVLGVTLAVVLAIMNPLQKLKRGLAREVEKRVPEFDGRIETYEQMKESNNPFIGLLAEDTMKIGERHSAQEQVPVRAMRVAGAVLGVLVVVFAWLLLAGPGLLGYSSRNLLGGWAIPNLLPPQSIAVTPGDESVRRGSNVRVTSVMEGFEPDSATIHIRSDNGEWQEVDMVQSPLGYEFTLFSMQKDTSYYISSTGLRSEEFNINVVDVPGIEKLELTYHYPEWTSRIAETFNSGDINALPETQIDLKVTTTSPLPAGELVLNKTGRPLSVDGTQASTEFTVQEEGEYYIAAIVGGEQVRISDDYFIRLTEDGKPELELVRPGGDYNASSIEEVLTRIEAKDDYGLETVALQYSVNGGDFERIELGGGERGITAEHLFMLEEMTTVATKAVQTNVGEFQIQLNEEARQNGSAPMPEETEVEEERIPLQPGDIISFYAEAADRTQTVRTDMYFIQVQPFNRRYSQSQLSGGGGGGAGGPQDEISERQRQIIVSTWNLIREQVEADNPTQIEVNSKLLSELQTTLAEQAATLAQRTRARQLAQDEQIEEFVNNMEQAVQRMHPASERLASVELNDAIQPAQEALQYLLRAESVFNDITLTQQQGGQGGAGRAQRDLAEMFELEMDLSLNQYETGNNASTQSQQEQAEDIMKKLDELAKRQEELARNMRNQQLSEAQRYQQAMLRREAEELQERLEQLQRQQQQQLTRNSQQQGESQQQQGQQSQQGQQGQPSPGQSGQAGQGGQSGQQIAQNEQNEQSPEGQAQEEANQSALQRRMQSALRAMQEAEDAMNGNMSPEEMQRAADEASRQLEGAREEIAREQMANMQQAFASMENQSSEMLREQERMARQLQEAMQKAVAERESGNDPNSRGMTLQEEWALAEEKQQLAADVRSLQQQMIDALQKFGRDVPSGAGNELRRANDEMTESQLEQAISDAALYIDAGYGLYIAGNESAVTNAMRRLSDRLERANDQVQSTGANGDTALDRARQQAEDLRSQLRQLAQGNEPGQQPGQNGQPQEGQQQGQQQGGNQPGGNNQQGGQRRGGAFGGNWNADDDFFSGPINLPDNFYNDVDDFTQQARNALEDLELNREELAQMYDMIRELEYTRVERNAEILAQEYNEMLALIEQLEVGLRESEDGTGGNVRTASGEVIPDEYKESVAEYFRKLSRD